jgi:hypothetical protein
MGKGKAGRTAEGKVRYSAFLRPDQIEALRAAQERSGVPVSEQIRRALDAALGTKPAPRRRA